MNEIIPKEMCVGCTACVNICPQKAISFIENEMGFKYPVINQDKCIDCGLCKKTCPVLNITSILSINKCYAGYTKEESYRKNSSSGGLFPLIAEKVLSQNGIVIGAAFDDNKQLNHIAITKQEDLYLLKGSKYLQSDLNNIFSFIKENVSQKIILFVGTPCQIAGLKNYLNKDYENLFCIDLICHGVPSQKLFNKYIKELEKNNSDTLVDYNFRDKSSGWETYSNKAIFKNKEVKELRKDNNYMKLYLSDIALRDCCYDCKFKLGNKYSDITLGDFWGIKSYYPNMYNKNGVSAIIVNTEKGNKIFESIKENLIYEPCRIEEIISGNKSLVQSCKRPNNKVVFNKDMDNMTFEELCKKYRKKIRLHKILFWRIKILFRKIVKKFSHT